MYFYKEDLINLIVPDRPDPAAAKVLQETLGGRFGEMRTMMQFFFQSSNFRGNAPQYRDLVREVFLEEISHVELVQHTINQLLTGAGESTPGSAGVDGAPLDEAIKHANPHHFIMGAQSSLPVDAAGNPWNGNYVYSHGNLISDLLDNLVFEHLEPRTPLNPEDRNKRRLLFMRQIIQKTILIVELARIF